DLGNYETPAYGAGCSGTLAHFGDSATCTITNARKSPPVVTVTKSCPNGKAADGDRFQVKLGGNAAGAPLDCDDSVDLHPTAGTRYTITARRAADLDLGNYDAPAYAAGCTGTLAHFGDSATCTITNALKNAPTVTVTKGCSAKAAPTD